MGRIEQRLELVEEHEPALEPIGEGERGKLLALAERLAEPVLNFETRLALVALIRGVLNDQDTTQVDWIPPPVLADAEIV